jgi:hypothetical protein
MKTILISAVLTIIGSSINIYPIIVYILVIISLVASVIIIGAINSAKHPCGDNESAISIRLTKKLNEDVYIKQIIFEVYGILLLLTLSLLFQVNALVLLFFSIGILFSLKFLIEYIDTPYGGEIELVTENIRNQKEKNE